MPRIGIIGGSGVYKMKELKIRKELDMDTPFGKPSGKVVVGSIGDVEVAFIPRHGPGHYYLPTEVNYRANIFCMKQLGVQYCIGISAVGSLQEEIVPGHVVLIDQYIDRTHHRQDTFYGKGVAGHVSMAHPICEKLRQVLLASCRAIGTTVHDGGCYVNIEGPTFGTIAESNLYRSWGAKVVGMTTLPEARLCMEAEISYAVMAMATDYDCWHPSHDSVTVAQVVATVNKNFNTSQATLKECVRQLSQVAEDSPRRGTSALGAVMTSAAALNHDTLLRLGPIVQDHLELAADVSKLKRSGTADTGDARTGVVLAATVAVLSVAVGYLMATRK